MPRTTVAIATVAVLALGAAGCGSSSHPASTKPLTAAQFRTQANAICKTYAAKTDALNPGTGATTAKIDAAVHQVAVLIAREVVEIRALKPPASMAKDVTTMLSDVAAGAVTLRVQGAKALTLASPFASADAEATALGLTECSQ